MAFQIISIQLAAMVVFFLSMITIVYLLVKWNHLRKDQQSLKKVVEFFSSPNQNKWDQIFDEIESNPLSQSIIAAVLQDVQKINIRNGRHDALLSNFHNIYFNNLVWSTFFIAFILVFSLVGKFAHGLIAVVILALFHHLLSQANKKLNSQIHRFTLCTLVPCFSQEPPEKHLADVSSTLTEISQSMDQKFKQLSDKIIFNQSSYTKLSDNLYATIVSMESTQHQLTESYRQIQVNLKKFNDISSSILQHQKDSQQLFENISNKIDMNKEDLSELYKQLRLYYKNLSESFEQTIAETAGMLRSASKLQDKHIQQIQKKYALSAKKKLNQNNTTT